MCKSRIDDVIASNSIKKMLFTPSGRSVWVVIGKYNEYWVDLELEFCTCKDFYFKTLSHGSACYHLKSIRKAIEENLFETIIFDDKEYLQLLQALMEDNLNLLSRS